MKEPEILEIGCSTGMLSFMIAPHVHSVIAIDAAKAMIVISLHENLVEVALPTANEVGRVRTLTRSCIYIMTTNLTLVFQMLNEGI